jgi:hypothetical protein
MKNIFLSILTFIIFSSVALADGHEIAKSGTISWVTGWQFNVVPLEGQSEDWVIGVGNASGATFNVNGSGPLHEGRALCAAVWVVSAGGATNKGNCYFGDKDGDRIFTSFTGDLAVDAGINTIIGGSGKYKGITGSGPWECDGAAAGDNGAFNCRQSLTYKIE